MATAVHDQAPLKLLAAGTGLRIVILSAVLLLAAYRPAYARLMIDGTAQQLVVDVDQEPLRAVLDALGARFGFAIKSPILSNAPMRGRFSGSITEVIKQLLRDYDVVIRTRYDVPASIDVIGVGRSNRSPMPAPSQSRPVTAPPLFDGR